MLSQLKFILRYFFFWIGVSLLARILFLLYQSNNSLELLDYIQIFWKGLRMDASLTGYIVLLASVIIAIGGIFKISILKRVLNIITLVLLIIFWLASIMDFELFSNWGYHADSSVFTYIKTPKEALASISIGLLIMLLLYSIALVLCCYWIYRRFILRNIEPANHVWLHIPVFLLIGGFMIIPIRGGFNVAPMNLSFVFFHPTNMYANQAAVNSVWNLMYEASHIEYLTEKYKYMPDEKAHAIVDSLYESGGNVTKLLKIKRPNVVFLLLESFSADAIESLGGEPGVTPRINELIKEGVLFNNIYSTGSRSDRGLTGVISGQPSHPDFSIIKYPNKMIAHPRFPRILADSGYNTRFYYAGDLNFGGFRSYITMSFNEYVTEDDFSGESVKNRFKWGIHDEYLFERLAKDVKEASQPFFYMAFNMSSHEPFDVPMERKIQGETESKRMLNSIYYADRSIGSFVDSLKMTGLWDSTLLVLVADHGTMKIQNRQPFEAATFHVPFILSGGAVTIQDTVITTIGSQIDIAATLLSQFGMSSSDFRYSKNLLSDSVQPFAYYAMYYAVGFVTEKGVTIWNKDQNQFITKTDSLDGEKVKAYLQVLDEDVN